uniref:UspA domain-containing protein n=1 Tax=Arion vulgaris TaxID=1028688 RepID=A0A0B6YUE7_9EUPU
MAEAVTVSRRILVGLDGSQNAFDAFECYMANVHRPNDYVIVAYSPNVSNSVINETVDFFVPINVTAFSDAVTAANERAMNVRKILEEKLKQSEVRGCVHMLPNSNVGHAIVKEAEKENVELIVIGSRGHGVIRRTILGSVSGYIVHHSHIPVLVQPNMHHKDKHHNEQHKEH